MTRARKVMMKIVIVMSVLIGSMSVYGADVRFTQPATKVAPKTTEATTSQTITFEEGEYVRVTQPLNTTGTTTVFDNQVNIQGQAREGTKITIKVYLSTSKEGNLLSDKPAVVYNLATVGKIQDFNQLIELGEGFNTVRLSYINEKEKDVEGAIQFVIKKVSKETKEALKSHLVTSDPILDKIGK